MRMKEEKAEWREHGRKHEKLNANTTITNRNTAQQRGEREEGGGWAWSICTT